MVAFATAAPAGDGEAAGAARVGGAAGGNEAAGAGRSGIAEVSYLGAAPDRWGEGLAAIVLRALTRQLAAAGYDAAQLLVYTDKLVARRLCERLGWETDAAAPAQHPRTGRLEQRYRLPSLTQ